jgi:hypothetical protein
MRILSLKFRPAAVRNHWFLAVKRYDGAAVTSTRRGRMIPFDFPRRATFLLNLATATGRTAAQVANVPN